ncbi:hypothetical protein HG530_007354 [Fusarium avenaceum]|nr:hypothetical protein HG530_007354 [Fusarium avenaceum]
MPSSAFSSSSEKYFSMMLAAKKIAEGLNTALGDQVANLLGLLETTGGSVADSPACLLTGLEVAVLEEMDQRRNDVGIDHGLDLGRVASSDVGNGPASLLADAILSRAEQGKETGQSAAVDNNLGLNIVTGNNVADRSQSGGLDGGGSMHEQLHQSAGDASFDDGLDLVVGSIGEVRDGPASINQDLIVKGVDELGQDRKGGGNLIMIGLGSLATAEVAKSPGSIAKHAQLTAIAEKVKKRLKGATAEDIVTTVRAVTSNVTKSPDGLFPDIGLRASKELNEDGNSASLDDDLGLCGGARSNVGQSPSSLELNQGVRGSQELDEAANNTGLDHLLNRRVTLLGKKLSELGGGLNLRIDLVREDALHHLGKVLIQLNTGG